MLKYNEDNSLAKRIAIISSMAGSGQELANRAHISRRVIGKYLAGESDPSRERLVAMAEAVGVSVEWLAAGRGAIRSGAPHTPPSPRHHHPTTPSQPISLDELSKAIAIVLAGAAMIQTAEQTSLSSNEHSVQKSFNAWLDKTWSTASDREKLLLAMQCENTFPEFLTWMEQQLAH